MELFKRSTIVYTVLIIYTGCLVVWNSYVTSYPPSLSKWPWIVKLYDYPIARICLFASILVTSFYNPTVGILYGICTAIISEDIIRLSHSTASSKQETEGFNVKYDTKIHNDMPYGNNVDNNEKLRKALNIQIARKLEPFTEAMNKLDSVDNDIKRIMKSRRHP